MNEPSREHDPIQTWWAAEKVVGEVLHSTAEAYEDIKHSAALATCFRIVDNAPYLYSGYSGIVPLIDENLKSPLAVVNALTYGEDYAHAAHAIKVGFGDKAGGYKRFEPVAMRAWNKNIIHAQEAYKGLTCRVVCPTSEDDSFLTRVLPWEQTASASFAKKALEKYINKTRDEQEEHPHSQADYIRIQRRKNEQLCAIRRQAYMRYVCFATKKLDAEKLKRIRTGSGTTIGQRSRRRQRRRRLMVQTGSAFVPPSAGSVIARGITRKGVAPCQTMHIPTVTASHLQAYNRLQKWTLLPCLIVGTFLKTGEREDLFTGFHIMTQRANVNKVPFVQPIID